MLWQKWMKKTHTNPSCNLSKKSLMVEAAKKVVEHTNKMAIDLLTKKRTIEV
jgi:hypothetical protein